MYWPNDQLSSSFNSLHSTVGWQSSACRIPVTRPLYQLSYNSDHLVDCSNPLIRSVTFPKWLISALPEGNGGVNSPESHRAIGDGYKMG